MTENNENSMYFLFENPVIIGVSRNDLCYIVINKHGTQGSG